MVADAISRVGNQRLSSGGAEAALTEVGAVVVHHRNYEVVGGTVASLIAEGVRPAAIVVVDNSEEPKRREALERAFPGDVCVLYEENLGYGHAVNSGIREFAGRQQSSPKFILVTTHEVRLAPGCVWGLQRALVSDQRAAAAGPTLVSGSDPEFVWSKGGYVSRWLHVPRHFGHREVFDPSISREEIPVPRTWLDGACVLYRFEDLISNGFDESYFMYMEEADLHVRLNARGRRVLWVPAAVAWQSSEGTPPFYLIRSLRIWFLRRNERVRGIFGVFHEFARAGASSVMKGRNVFPQLVAGLVARVDEVPKPSRATVAVLNPLGGALKHYVRELIAVLNAAGAEAASVVSFEEPSVGGEARLVWLVKYVQLLSKDRVGLRRGAQRSLIVTWPVLGYLDVMLIRLLHGRGAWLVMHDPVPLVRSVGYGRISRALARRCCRGVGIVVHSQAAKDAVVAQGWPESRLLQLPHPIFPPEAHAPIETETSVSRRRRLIVRVLGQYKPDRDLTALAAIAKALGGEYQLEIRGRGWPQVPGWDVVDGFLSEDEMDLMVRTADVVVIPYSRFFQSGVAIRAIEAGVAVVGPLDSSLGDIFKENPEFLVTATQGADGVNPWVRAVAAAGRTKRGQIVPTSRRISDDAVEAWSRWVNNQERGE